LKDGNVTIRYLATPIVRPSWTIRDGVLYAGLYPQIVSSAIAKTPQKGKSIIESDHFAALRERLGAGKKVTSIKYLDLPRTAPTMYSTWLVLGGYAGLGDLFGVPVPGMLIPPLDDLLTHLAPTGTVTWTDESGWYMNGVTPFPGAQLVSSDPTVNIAAPALMTSILLPSLNRARETANRVKCASNMRQIGQAILLYSNDNRGKYPPDLGTLLKTQDITIEVFTCPSSYNEIPGEIRTADINTQAQWVNENASYTYVGAGMNNAAGAEEVVLYEKRDNHDEDGMNFLFGDGHVTFEMMESAEQLINQPRPDRARDRVQ
jgi:prepilin-type processing-associated H-X9-DG protein